MPKRVYKEVLEPYEGIIRFVVALMAAHFAWKYTVVGDDGTGMVSWMGWDITAPFAVLSHHFAELAYAVLHGCGSAVVLTDTCLHYPNGNGTTVVWSCTALKQTFIWVVIMLSARGEWKHKGWFVPLGVVAIYLFNLIRIICIAMIVEHHPQAFEVWHGYIFKYVFYGMFFLLWWVWDTHYSKSAKENKEQLL